MAKAYRQILQLTAVLLVLAAVCIYQSFDRADARAEEVLLPVAYELQGGDFAIDLNTAEAELLILLPEIGVTLAERIVEYRETNGDFACVDQLINVYGIGETTLERVRPFLTVSRSGS